MAVLESAPSYADQAVATLTSLKRMRGFSDARLAARASMSRSAIVDRRRHVSGLKVSDLQKLAIALEVHPKVFLMDPIEAQRWVLDHAPTLELDDDESTRSAAKVSCLSPFALLSDGERDALSTITAA